jgi:hypothetical protein
MLFLILQCIVASSHGLIREGSGSGVRDVGGSAQMKMGKLGQILNNEFDILVTNMSQIELEFAQLPKLEWGCFIIGDNALCCLTEGS